MSQGDTSHLALEVSLNTWLKGSNNLSTLRSALGDGCDTWQGRTRLVKQAS